ncbi:hypothetical protein EVA_08968 [gut metagenome]|uniref:Uncharacterized protein n=1 Tax=gut metagenome TaxID=749906 RepID=J9G6P6_9ZZZZ
MSLRGCAPASPPTGGPPGRGPRRRSASAPRPAGSAARCPRRCRRCPPSPSPVRPPPWRRRDRLPRPRRAPGAPACGGWRGGRCPSASAACWSWPRNRLARWPRAGMP